MAQTLHELLRCASQTSPDRTALISDPSSLTYAELNLAAQSLARSLIAAGVSPGDRVGLCLPKSIDSIVAVYGILMAGACYVPIDPAAPVKRAAYIAANVTPKALVANAEQAKRIGPTIATRLIQLDVFVNEPDALDDIPGCTIKGWHCAANNSLELPKVDDGHLAYILHTSGSTGQPKGVAISHKSALTFVEMAADFFSITQDDRLCSQAPLHFDLSVFDLYVACSRQAAVVLLPEYYSAFPRKYVSAISDSGISVWNSVSSALTLIMDNGAPDPNSLQSVRVVMFSGEAMPTKYLRKLQQNFISADLYNGYGQTEANTSMYFRVDSVRDDNWRIPIGKAFPEYEVFAVDDNQQQIDKPGIEGELYVCSDAVADGYWENPELTATRFIQHAGHDRVSTKIFKTGDKVRINDDGDFEFIGRTDDMIKSRGYRIELGEIEQSILSYSGVEAAACIPIEDDKIGNRLIAYVSCATVTAATSSKISEHIRDQLPAYMVPEKILFLKDLPRTATGKIDRTALRDKIAASSA